MNFLHLEFFFWKNKEKQEENSSIMSSTIDSPKDYFNSWVPPEILLMVFKRLNFTDLDSCARVCKIWNELITDNYLKVNRKIS